MRDYLIFATAFLTGFIAVAAAKMVDLLIEIKNLIEAGVTP